LELSSYLGGQLAAVVPVPAVALAVPLAGVPLIVAPGTLLVPLVGGIVLEAVVEVEPLGVVVVPPVVAVEPLVVGLVEALPVVAVVAAPVVLGVVAAPVPVAVVPTLLVVDVVPTPVPFAVVLIPEVGVTGHGFARLPVFVGTVVVPAWFTPVAVLGELI
jgi:hypothetical protein